MELLKLETEKTMRIWGIYDTEKVKRQAGSIYDSQGLAPSLDTCGGGYRMPIIVERIGERRGMKDNETDNRQGGDIVNVRIRKLTPKECWRLMGFNDEDFDKAKEVCSDSQLYRQAGNSIVVQVLESIFKEML